MLKISSYTFLFVILLSSCQSKLNTDISVEKDFKKEEQLTIGSTSLFSSKIMGEDRPIIISLPQNYAESEADYPVLYLTDGLQNIWHSIGTAEVLTRTGSMPPMIIVGIESTNRDRDFSPTADENWPRSGGGPKFSDFIEKELIPYIDANYRTHPFRILEGHSLGGLFTVSVLLNKPDLFDAHIIMSPSLWWKQQEIIKQAETFFKSQPNLEKRLFFGIGTNESGTEWGMRKELQNFIDVLKANKPEKVEFKHQEMLNEGHMSSTLLSNYYGLKFIFSDMEVPDSLIANYSDEKFLKHEEMIKSKYGKEAKQSAEAYVRIAYSLMEDKNLSGAITVIKRSVEAYSFDLGLLNFLASIYEKNENIEMAISTYTEAIKISEKYNYGREEEFKGKIKRLKEI
ncbi:alpha/beta hydrolase [Lutimonas saemankumensis]|uniref:alpha/beta hydrolase-fold protein n=1 Tax=Lutimonas saemankumensis TaxID=483016 RepID=UPI001CD4EF68|nr:alpha/beta hydrolase-fold protein [Lutimonas saemankumensis]MCA0931304.1 alpha/beta hydrolase [Lutimonas saemankumensis]